MAKKSKLRQIDGKLDIKEEKRKRLSKFTTLDQVWGDTGLSRYKTLDLDEYKKYLSSLANVDLHRHSTEVGLIPVDSRSTLELRLCREFEKHVASYRRPEHVDNLTKKKISKNVLDILSEGR